YKSSLSFLPWFGRLLGLTQFMLIGRRLNDYQANQHTHFVRWDAYTWGGCAIMPHMSAPVIGKLGDKENLVDGTKLFRVLDLRARRCSREYR
ncbi:hypothetical protein, partial [Alteromonas portus]|uniref:hypothetical protein n=1 Tax=Alteromonas portus TaxID=2565549 RepID=UPI00196B96DA